jgi:hypothetical protein
MTSSSLNNIVVRTIMLCCCVTISHFNHAVSGKTSSLSSLCERWSTNINLDMTQAIYFNHRRRPVEATLILRRRNIPFVSHIKYVCVIFDKKITWKIHTDMIEELFYSLFKGQRLSASFKPTPPPPSIKHSLGLE